jgi:hypothetical protein
VTAAQNEDLLQAELSADGSILAVTVPLEIRRRGGRKQIVTPEGEPAWAPRQRGTKSTLIKALGRAFRWRKLLEEGVYGTIEELATAEKINVSYVSRVLRLTLLAPDVVDGILDGREFAHHHLFRPFPLVWKEQRRKFRLIT